MVQQVHGCFGSGWVSEWGARAPLSAFATGLLPPSTIRAGPYVVV